MGPDLKTDPAIITQTTKAVLVLADKQRLTSVALPAICAGVGHIPPADSAEAMLPTVVEHLKGGKSTLKRVVFVLYLDETSKAFTATLKRLGGA
jgi:O-acetyl-ADP-ribose deacetylase (regulator of RNase III)